MRIGTSSPSVRRRLATSIPSSRGRPRSSTSRSGRKAWYGVQRGDAVAGELDLVALDAQRALQDLGDVVVVLDDEHAGGAGVHF